MSAFFYSDDIESHMRSKSIVFDKLICSCHTEDDFINSYIKKSGKKGYCSYCKNSSSVITLESFCNLLDVGIDFLFEEAVEALYLDKDGEHGYAGNTFDSIKIFYDDMLELKINNSIIIDNIINVIYFNKIYYKREDIGDEYDFYSSIWLYFKEIVKHKARFVFYFKGPFNNIYYNNPFNILNDIQEYILKNKLLKVINTSCKIFRCTQHKLSNEVKNDGVRIASNPDRYCKNNNRLSPAGISMFYGSPNEEITIQEVVNLNDKENRFYTTAIFTPFNKLKLVDFTKLPTIPSIFDKVNNDKILFLSFLYDFVKDISKPIKKDDAIIEYVPTQIITEYIKFNPKLKVDGIILPSSKDENKSNYILFMNHEESLDKLIFHPESIRTYSI